MKRPGQWLPPEVTLGFFVGILFCLMFAGPLSYQASYCAETQPQHHKDGPAEKDVETPSAHQSGNSGYAQQSESDKPSPIICTPLTLFGAAVGFMDHHEGALVGFFTALLFGATTLLWYSTNKLWDGGERHSERQLRAYIGPGQRCIIDLRKNTPTVFVQLENFGQTPALNVVARTSHEWVNGGTRARKTIVNSLTHDFGLIDPRQAPEIVVELNGISTKDVLHSVGQYVHIQTVVTYTDIFGSEHTREFSLYSSPALDDDYSLVRLYPVPGESLERLGKTNGG